MKYIIYSTIILSLILQTSCSRIKNIDKTTFLIELKTTSCYGTCPVYELLIYSNGTAYLKGIKHLDKIGEYSSKLNYEKLNELKSEFERINFFELQDAYQSKFKDLPTKYISYFKNGETKTIMAYDNIPKDLNNLIKKIENLLKELDWEAI